jgi:hypothetical protein
LSYAKIGKELGISGSSAHGIVKEAPQTRPEALEIAEPISPLPVIETASQGVPDVPIALETAEPIENLMLVPPATVKPKRQGRGRPPIAESGEVKRATTIAILPSVYEATRKICYVQRRSISDVINGFLKRFVAQNLNDLEKY